MNLLKGMNITLPDWAQDILNDPDRSVAEGLASVGYPEKASDEYEALRLEKPDEFVHGYLPIAIALFQASVTPIFGI
ncbi:hypothetical protein PENSPDRAFT_694374 [Peniophora sp. CONT]|nr:hypothetical protein PENSPDRAFT_694374 [Peniophora sp. CONT]